MSRLDDELRETVEAHEAEASPDSSSAPDSAPGVAASTSNEQSRRSIGLLVTLLVMGGAILGLVFFSLDDSTVYSRGVEQLLAERETAVTAAQASEDGKKQLDRLYRRNTRVVGMLVKGSLSRRDKPCEYRFKVQSGEATLPVRYAQCVVPDTFRDVPDMDVEVTVTGKLTAEGHFEAENIMAKCPSKYEMQQRKENGEAVPHGDVQPVKAIN